MAKWGGVLMVPTVIEFESEGSYKHVTEQAKRVAQGMGRAPSLKIDQAPYEPKLMEVCITEGEPPKEELNIVFTPELA
jgi:hypothetical protein